MVFIFNSRSPGDSNYSTPLLKSRESDIYVARNSKVTVRIA